MLLQFPLKIYKLLGYHSQYHLLIKQQIARTLSACFIFLHRVIAMRILFKEHFERGIAFNAIFHCGLMFIGMVILQAWPNEGISQSGTKNHNIPF